MTPEQLAEYRQLLVAGKVADDKLSEQRAFLRGWNEGVAFAELMLKHVSGGKNVIQQQ